MAEGLWEVADLPLSGHVVLQPWTTSNSASTVPSSSRSGSGVLRRNASGPAVASTPSATCSTQGTMDP
jgi:hypothetical protein